MEVDEKEELLRKMTSKLAEIHAPPAAEKVIQEQLKKMSMLEPASPEFSMTRTYLDWLVAIPWGISTQDSLDVASARQVLDCISIYVYIYIYIYIFAFVCFLFSLGGVRGPGR